MYISINKNIPSLLQVHTPLLPVIEHHMQIPGCANTTWSLLGRSSSSAETPTSWQSDNGNGLGQSGGHYAILRRIFSTYMDTMTPIQLNGPWPAPATSNVRSNLHSG